VNQLLELYSRCLKPFKETVTERGGAIAGDRQLRVAVAGAGAFGATTCVCCASSRPKARACAGGGRQPGAARADEAASSTAFPVFASIDALLKAI